MVSVPSKRFPSRLEVHLLWRAFNRWLCARSKIFVGLLVYDPMKADQRSGSRLKHVLGTPRDSNDKTKCATHNTAAEAELTEEQLIIARVWLQVLGVNRPIQVRYVTAVTRAFAVTCHLPSVMTDVVHVDVVVMGTDSEQVSVWRFKKKGNW